MSTGTLNITFIQATNDVDVHWNAPIAFGYLKAYLEHRVATSLCVSTAATTSEVVAQAPHVVGISSLSQDFGEAMRIADFVKQNSDALVVLGGQHISAFPQTLPASVDVGVIGEGEQTFGELISILVKDGGLPHQTLSRIRGLAFRDAAGQLRLTEPRPLIQPLDVIPIPDRTLGRSSEQRPSCSHRGVAPIAVASAPQPATGRRCGCIAPNASWRRWRTYSDSSPAST